ncbi:ketopantoate hydroxymethyltransferase [Carboxydocella sporoproducens DSM 16521]|uniref:3-methyl-2-oxobutanoate hydroxymethyltransferase n=2 Tax=Carboxydocella TaxID=178898 RepID=A0A1T4RLK8_9FIRM|nr:MULTISPECIES: 3-methyl-2-oxobutanoate hydroxymethyltransferase [Carboxydocella]AVX19311.1 ketopantoate hydroxymethyltransferase [Carboxydocella thermautotrophica]SKA16571.1 ketopantoate hydroxymethyltransferase [Carboxydocella sporoproducens DSM 16521]
MARITTTKLKKMKESGEKITMLTCYDYSTAVLLDEAGVDVLLVGDSLGMVILGYDSTLPVTMAEMLHHTRAVARGAKQAMVVGDMPFMSYQVSCEEAVRNAGRFLQEAGAQAVKLEGGREVVPQIRAIVQAGIPVMGHLGLTPQHVHRLGGYSVQGKEDAARQQLLEDARLLVEVGVFAIVLECVPVDVARMVTEAVDVPTIGIGAGPYCDGQVLVTQDMLGLYRDLTPRFVRRYASLQQPVKEAVQAYIQEVKAGSFPGPAESFGWPEKEPLKVY